MKHLQFHLGIIWPLGNRLLLISIMKNAAHILVFNYMGEWICLSLKIKNELLGFVGVDN